MLCDSPNGYENLKTHWDEISILHKKLLDFVAIRLSAKYKIPLNNTVPAHLLGKLNLAIKLFFFFIQILNYSSDKKNIFMIF